MRIGRCAITAAAAVLWAVGSAAFAQPVSSVITYQGQLKSGGAPANGDFAMVFRLFDHPTAGTMIWDHSATVTVTDGLFTEGLYFPEWAYNGQERYVEVVVAGTPLTPRQRLAPAPYAIYSLLPWYTEGGSIYYEAGNVGIGTNSPGNTLSVAGGITVDQGGTSSGGLLHGLHFGGDDHGEGITSEKAGGGNLNGLDFYTNHTPRVRITNGGNVGIGTTTPGAKLQVDDGAIRLRNNADNKNWDIAYDSAGDYFYIDEFGVGRHLQIANGGNVGIGAPPVSQYGLALFGQNGLLATAHSTFAGVTGQHIWSEGGTGVLGRSETRYRSNDNPPIPQPAYGVRGEAFANVTNDVPGFPDGTNTDAFGVYGSVTIDGISVGNSGFFAGVLGRALFPTSNTFGVFSEGDFGATGTKSFQIDHPLDPENKMLKHYCAEGPEPLNVYSGTIVTDATGTAWVQLPDYFEAINRDPRYQLTVIGTFAQAIIGEELDASGAPDGKGNRFSIRTSVPNVKVSWEVKAVRNDRFVQQAGAPVEVNKGSTHRGKYLSPHLYGQPREKSMFHNPATSREQQPEPAGAAAARSR